MQNTSKAKTYASKNQKYGHIQTQRLENICSRFGAQNSTVFYSQ